MFVMNGGNTMTESVNEIIARLADIEETAGRIVESAEDEKKELKKKYDDERVMYDEQLKNKTEQSIKNISEELEEQEKREIDCLKGDMEKAMHELDVLYINKKVTWSEEIFKSIIEV